jgi:D-proline reductase (dithiol) PrdB
VSLKDSLFRFYTRWRSPAMVDGALVRPRVPLSQMTIALVTTAGVRLRMQPPFNHDGGDASFRLIPDNAPAEELVPDHTHYDTSHAETDINCIFPLPILRQLQQEGFLGKVSPAHVGVMGYIRDTERLISQSIPALIRELVKAKVDGVLLSPG